VRCRAKLVKPHDVTALTAHLVMPQGQPGDAFLHEIAHELEHRFRIGHATVQVETGAEEHCTDCA